MAKLNLSKTAKDALKDSAADLEDLDEMIADLYEIGALPEGLKTAHEELKRRQVILEKYA